MPFLRKIKILWPYGANIGIDRNDLIRVNGFDEDFVGWGGEDIDLSRRLGLIGVDYHGTVGRCIVFHLHHPVREPDDGNSNVAKIKQKKLQGYEPFAENGLDKWI